MKLSPEQQLAVTHIYEQGETFIYGPMGSGKTVTAYTAAEELLKDGFVKRVLVLAPPKVAKHVWPNEKEKWSHLLTDCVFMDGSPNKRLNVLNNPALAPMVVASINTLPWLVEQKYFETFDMLIVDESTKLKSHGTYFKALRRHLGQFTIRVAMTGTPVSENFEQIFYQCFLVDNGSALGRNKSKFMARYFDADDPYSAYPKYTIREPDLLINKIKHMIVELPEYTSDLPPCSEQTIPIMLPPSAMDYYQNLERDSLTDDVTADSAAVLVGKLAQAASGFVYTDDQWTLDLHHEKTKALDTLLSIAGRENNVVVVYQFKEELIRLRSMFPRAHEIKNFEAFKRDGGMLLLHPKSAGHGLDITNANIMVFMSPVWSRDLTRQTIARVWRRGQTEAVQVYWLIAGGTIEEEIQRREKEKGSFQDLLTARLNAL